MATFTSTTSSAPLHQSIAAAPPPPPSSQSLALTAPPSRTASKRASLALPASESHSPRDRPSGQEQEPDASLDDIMQHPLWAQRGTERLPSQDMEKHQPIDYRSHRIEDQKSAEAAVRKDLGALFSLMLVMPFVGIGITVYALAAFLLVTLAAPIILLAAGQAAVKRRYLKVLLPGLNLHYRMAYSSRRCWPEAAAPTRSWPGSVSIPQSPSSSGFSDLDEKLSPTPSIAWVMTVLLFSPLLSLPVAMANFVIMFFWFMSAVTESASSGSSMDDGRMMAKRVRRFWVRWLSGEVRQGSQRRKRARPAARV